MAERLARGAVTDWIHLAPYPPYFNLADVAIRGGLLAVAVVILVQRRRAAVQHDVEDTSTVS